MKQWDEKRYFSLNYFLRQKFGEKVFKIPLDAGFTCPNRDGKISKGGCIFCSSRGSGDFTGNKKDLVEQFYEVKELMNKKWKEGKYIAYFQAYTNTYGSVEELREKYYSIINLENVVGLAIATRPDCLDRDVLELLTELNERTYLWVELGLQTTKIETAEFINRGYTNDKYIQAVKALSQRNIELVTHVILGLPGENHQDMLNTVDFVANSGTKGIKLHLLHVLRNTRLLDMYEKGNLELLSKDEYVELVVECIERLPEDMVIHRLTGDGPRDTLAAPVWSLKKWEVINAIDYLLMDKSTWQGKQYKQNESIRSIFK